MSLFNLSLWHLFQKLIPAHLREEIGQIVFYPKYLSLLRYFKVNPGIAQNYTDEIEYLRLHRRLALFPYDFVKSYDMKTVKVHKDHEQIMHYVIHSGKKLYFPRNMTINNIKKTYNDLCIEQDIRSPHRYFTQNFQVMSGDVFVDIGSAEGLMALESVEKSKAIVLFERDPLWVEALEATFKPWEKKVTIINKIASDYVSESTTTIDHHFANSQDAIMLKIDVEGGEHSVLRGAKNTLALQQTRIVCCTYHRNNDNVDLKTVFDERRFTTEFSKGYVLWYFDLKIKPPFFRKGVIRAWR